MSWSFLLPTRITFGEGVFRTPAEWWGAELGERVGLITSPSQRTQADWLARERPVAAVWNQVSTNPTVSSIQALIDWVKAERFTGLVALGGGSVIDSAKVAAVLGAQQIALADVLGKQAAVGEARLPLIAFPTTAGTGAEVTKWATVWGEDHKKYSFEHELAFPTHALIDPVLTYSLPGPITASTGLDALTQAIEAYWSRKTQPLARTFALQAVERIHRALPRAVQQPSDRQARHDMALGSLFAGLAFTGTRTTACHAISYPMTAHFGVPHGFAVALTLPSLLRFNAPELDEPLPLARALGARSLTGAAKAIEHLMAAVGAPRTLTEANIPAEGIATILDEGFHPDRVVHNPRTLNRAELSAMLNALEV